MIQLQEVRKGEWLELRTNGDSMTDTEWLEWLRSRQTAFPEKVLARLLREHGVEADGKRLRLRLFPREEAETAGEWHDLPILYEDDFCLVAYKPAGMAVHASYPGHRGTLAQAVAYHYEETGQHCRIRHIHRLDEDTTGPVLYAKNEYAHLLLDAAMRDKTISRTYVALAQGRLQPPEGLIDAPIGKDRSQPGRRRVSPSGDPARTRYRTLEQAPHASLVELRLETGRTHQIRVHLSHRGAPLVGDALYGGSPRLLNRQALHGVRLDFDHPWNGGRISVEAPLPEDLARCWDELRAGARP